MHRGPVGLLLKTSSRRHLPSVGLLTLVSAMVGIIWLTSSSPCKLQNSQAWDRTRPEVVSRDGEIHQRVPLESEETRASDAEGKRLGVFNEEKAKERRIREKYSRLIESAGGGAAGEGGAGVRLEGEEALLGKESIQKHGLNVLASDRISLVRSLPEARHPDCLRQKFSTDLPSATAVIPFYNEHLSTLLRTVHNLFDSSRTPQHLLREVILVDDFSTNEELGPALDEHLLERFGGRGRVVRHRERGGLIRARNTGAHAASADVIIFFDSHCEMFPGWLEPMLQVIRDKPKTVVTPVNEQIHYQDFSVHGTDFNNWNYVPFFNWALLFIYARIPDREKKRRTRPTDTFRAPGMLGGQLAIRRDFFLKLGGYDPGLEIWGGENVELSIKAWLCGGSVEIPPCAVVAHLLRTWLPYSRILSKNGSRKDTADTNAVRVAEVWLDQYKDIFYTFRTGLKERNIYFSQFQPSDGGDVSARLELKRRLGCRPFSYFLQHVWPEFFTPDKLHAVAIGWVRNNESNLCLDKTYGTEELRGVLNVWRCAMEFSSKTQGFSLARTGELRHEETCVATKGKVNDRLTRPYCEENPDKNTKWKHQKASFPFPADWLGKAVSFLQNGQLVHMRSGLCLDVKGQTFGGEPYLNTCDAASLSQRWSFQKYY